MKKNSNIGVYDSEFEGDSEYQLCFSIGLILLWQIAKKHQNCVGGGVGGGAADHHQIARHWPSNPPNTMLITKNNSNLGVYDSEFQGESEYQLCFLIGAMILWQNAKNTQNYDQIKLEICDNSLLKPSPNARNFDFSWWSMWLSNVLIKVQTRAIGASYKG
jgi:hypothetical protein